LKTLRFKYGEVKTEAFEKGRFVQRFQLSSAFPGVFVRKRIKNRLTIVSWLLIELFGNRTSWNPI